MPLTAEQLKAAVDTAVKDLPCGSGGTGSRGVRPGYDLFINAWKDGGQKMRNLVDILNGMRDRGVEAATARALLAGHQAIGVEHYPLGTLANLLHSHFWCEEMAEKVDGETCYHFPAEPYDPAFLFSVWGSKLPFDLMVLAIKAGSNGNGNGHAAPAQPATTGGVS